MDKVDVPEGFWAKARTMLNGDVFRSEWRFQVDDCPGVTLGELDAGDDDPDQRKRYRAMQVGETITVGGGAAAEFTITRTA